jgi:hypothetical protein
MKELDLEFIKVLVYLYKETGSDNLLTIASRKYKGLILK